MHYLTIQLYILSVNHGIRIWPRIVNYCTIKELCRLIDDAIMRWQWRIWGWSDCATVRGNGVMTRWCNDVTGQWRLSNDAMKVKEFFIASSSLLYRAIVIRVIGLSRLRFLSTCAVCQKKKWRQTRIFIKHTNVYKAILDCLISEKFSPHNYCCKRIKNVWNTFHFFCRNINLEKKGLWMC